MVRSRRELPLLAASTIGLAAGLTVFAAGILSAAPPPPNDWREQPQFGSPSQGAPLTAAGPQLAATESLLEDDSLLSGDGDLLVDEPAQAAPADDGGLLSGDDSLLTDEPAPSDDGGLLTGDDSLLTDEPAPSDDGGLLTGDDSLLTDEPAPSDDGGLLTGDDAAPEEETVEGESLSPEDAFSAHEEIFIGDLYPSANACATCHPRQYGQWSVSQHAYAQLSPVFNAMQTTINIKTGGTNGDFCIRCHNQVGMNLGESVYGSNLDRPATSREGITCVVCHRVGHNYGKESGRLALVEGDIFDPVAGPTGDAELKRVLEDPEYRVNTKRGEPGRAIHTDVTPFFSMTEPGFCGSCHDVTLLNGFRLEEAFAEYQQSPASLNGVSCQDCHMGKEQGVNAGYEIGPAAVVGGVPTRDRKVTNHFFAGPDYSVVHPGIFPHNVRAADFKTLSEWLLFDVEAGWGTDEFEDNAPADYKFPEPWYSIDDRYDGRDIINEQLERLAWARERRQEVLRNGFGLSEVDFQRTDGDGISFSIDVRNLTDGHAVPTGFDAERLIFLEVTLTDSEGKVLYVSGDRDPNGDVRDLHSSYVHNGELPLDEDLFNLQSKFIVRLFRGGEREQILAVNESMSVLPFVRPEARATTIYGRPNGARKHKKTIEALGSRTAQYDVDGDLLTGAGPYNLTIRLISQMIPVNLLSVIQAAGFDYGISPAELGDRLVEGADVIATRTLEIDTGTGTARPLEVSQNTE